MGGTHHGGPRHMPCEDECLCRAAARAGCCNLCARAEQHGSRCSTADGNERGDDHEAEHQGCGRASPDLPAHVSIDSPCCHLWAVQCWAYTTDAACLLFSDVLRGCELNLVSAVGPTVPASVLWQGARLTALLHGCLCTPSQQSHVYKRLEYKTGVSLLYWRQCYTVR